MSRVEELEERYSEVLREAQEETHKEADLLARDLLKAFPNKGWVHRAVSWALEDVILLVGDIPRTERSMSLLGAFIHCKEILSRTRPGPLDESVKGIEEILLDLLRKGGRS